MRYKFLILLLPLLFNYCESSITNSDIEGSSIIIRFSIPTESAVKLTVENSYNTIIAIPVDRTLLAGFYEVQVDTDGWAEGVYFYTLVANGIESTKKFLLLKK